MSSTKHRTVVVAGMGPVGMTAALALAREGVEVTLIEAGPALATESRASTFHPPSLEILDDLGVADELIATGLRAPVIQYREQTGEVLAALDMGLLSEETAFPFRIQNEQHNLTRIIHERLVTMPNVRVLFDAPVERVEVASHAARVFLPGDGLEPSLTADWLIAADGANSATRRSLGIAFEGITYPKSFLVVSTTHDFREDFPGLAYVSYISDPEDWGVLLRTPRHWRVLFPIEEHERPEDVQAEAAVEARMQRLVSRDAPYPVSHTTLYRVHQRVASTFAVGTVLLAGDAAHINNPLGGMGMNSGIHDARAAADSVLAALGGVEREHCSSVYSRVRRDAATGHVQRQTKANYEDLQQEDASERRARFSRLADVAADPEKARTYLRQTAMLDSYRESRGRLHRELRPGTPTQRAPAGRRLSDLIDKGALVLPGCYDALTARLVAGAGFSVAFVSGAAVSAAAFGAPDLGFVTGSDLAEVVRRITDAVDLPLVVDADTGFGGVLQVASTVRAYELAGAAALTLEDQVTPKRCGHMAGVTVVSVDDMVAKLRAALDARRHLLVIARTDALGCEGLSGAVKRAVAYARAGADLVFVEGVRTSEVLRTVHAAVRAAAPEVALVISRSEAAGGAGDALTQQDLVDNNVALVLHPVTALLAAAGAARDSYQRLAAGPDPTRSATAASLTWGELTDTLDLPKLVAADQRLTPPPLTVATPTAPRRTA